MRRETTKGPSSGPLLTRLVAEVKVRGRAKTGGTVRRRRKKSGVRRSGKRRVNERKRKKVKTKTLLLKNLKPKL